MLAKIILFLIKIYQKTLSPDKGPLKIFFPHKVCRFYPSCSDYLSESIKIFGVMKGVRLGLRRIIKCHPFHAGGIDEVPRKD